MNNIDDENQENSDAGEGEDQQFEDNQDTQEQMLDEEEVHMHIIFK